MYQYFPCFGMAITFPFLQIDGICFVRVHSLSMSWSQNLALLPRCSISVSRSSKQAAFTGFNRLSEASCEFVQAERLSKLSWWLVVTWNDCFVVHHSSPIRQKLVSDLVSSDGSDHGR